MSELLFSDLVRALRTNFHPDFATNRLISFEPRMIGAIIESDVQPSRLGPRCDAFHLVFALFLFAHGLHLFFVRSDASNETEHTK